MIRALVACVFIVGGCVTSNLTFTCGPTKSCGSGGQCINGACAFTDASCPSGMRYDKSANGGRGGSCVDIVMMTVDMSVAMVSDMSGTVPIDIAQRPIDIAGADLTCTPTGAENCFDGLDNDCNGLTDCSDPACNTIAECVPDETGWELGTLSTPGTPVGNNCPTHYTAQATFVGNGVNALLTCTGCTCSGSLVCSVSLSEMVASTCPGGSLVSGQSTTADNTHCENNNNAANGWNWTTQNVLIGALQTATGCTCTGKPAPTTPSFTTSYDFCETTQKGGGCNAGFVCAPKLSSGQHCILQAGTTTCPGNYAVQGSGSWYTSINDQRMCGTSCMYTKSGGTCGSQYHIRAFVNNTNCTGAADILSAGTSGCGQSTPLDSFNITLGSDFVNPTCTPNYSASGSGAGQGPQTLCCL
jgi:hypothetical protein